MDPKRKLSGLVFSDLGQASSFMKLDWVQRRLQQTLGFAAFPATLNLRPMTNEDLKVWQSVRRSRQGIPLLPADDGFCAARLYPVELQQLRDGGGITNAAVLVPEVPNYPEDKIEIVATVRLKDDFGVKDGDSLTLEFVS